MLNNAGAYVGEELTLAGNGNGLIGPNNFNSNLDGAQTISEGNALQPAGALLLETATGTWTGNINLFPGTEISATPVNATGVEGLTILGSIGDAPGMHGDLIKGGNGDLVLQANNTYTGATDIDFGDIILDAAGAISSSSAINLIGPASPAPTWPLVNTGNLTPVIAASSSSGNFVSTNSSGGLTLDNMAINFPGRIGGSIPINSYGATILQLGSNIAGGVSTEQLGSGVNLIQSNTVLVNANTGGGLAQLQIPVLTRAPGAAVEFFGDELQLSTFSLKPALGSSQSQIMIGNYANGNAPLINGILPFAVVATPGVVTWDLATYGSDGITAYASGLGTPVGQQYATCLAAAGPNDNVRLTSSESLLINKTVNAVVIVGATTVSENSQTLTVNAGTILAANNTGSATTATITGGSVNFGTAEGVLFTPSTTGVASNLAVVSTIVGSGGLTIAGGSTYSGITATGGSTVTLSSDNTYTGVTSLDGGSFDLGTAYSLGTSTLQFTNGLLAANAVMNVPNPINLNNSLVTFGGASAMTLTGPIGLTNSVLPDNFISITNSGGTAPAGGFLGVAFAGLISGTGGLTIQGSTGVTNTFLTITRANTFTGGVVFAGVGQATGTSENAPAAGVTLTLGNNNALGTGTVVLNAGNIQSNVAVNIPNPIIFDNNNLNPFIGTTSGGSGNVPITSYQVNNSISFGTAGTNVGNLLLGAPSLTFSGPVSVTGPFTLNSETPNATEFTGQITGQGGFTVSSSGLATTATTGAIIFSGPNTFSGGIDVVGGSSGANAAGAVTTLGIGSGSASVINSSGQLISGPFGTGTLSFYNNQQNGNGNGVIIGATTTTLQVPDDGGNYVLGNHIYLDDQTTFQVGATNPNTTLTLAGTTVGGLDGSSDPLLVGVTIAADGYNGYEDVLTKTGPGTLSVGVPSTIGYTNINNGTLIMNGAATAPLTAFTINNGATLGIDNTALNVVNRLPAHGPSPTGAALTFGGGTLSYIGAPGTLSTDHMGPIQLNAGAATIQSTPGAGGGTVVLTSAGLTRKVGGTINFVGIGSPIAPVATGSTPTNQFIFSTPPQATPTNNPETIASVVLTNLGAGYTSAPQVTLTGGGGTFTSATATINSNGQVTGVTINGATNYTSLPTVTINPPSLTATASATISTPGGTNGGTVLAITPVSLGTGYTSVPSVTITGGGATLNALATAVLNGDGKHPGEVTSIIINNPGAGYVTSPLVTISPPTSQAFGSAQISTAGANIGQVTTISLTGTNPNTGGTNSGGSGYTSPPPNVKLIGGGGTYTSATATVVNGVVTAITIASSSGYTSDPTVIISPPPAVTATGTAIVANPDGFLPFGTVTGTTANAYDFATDYTGDNGQVGIGPYLGYATSLGGAVAGSQATAGTITRTADQITAIAVGAIGSGYTTAPNVTITGGGGSGATATATISGGVVISITVTNGGTNYSANPTVTIDPPLGDVVKETQTSDTVLAAGSTIAGLLFASPTPTTITLTGKLTVSAGAIAAATGSGSGNQIGGSGTQTITVPVVDGSAGITAEAFLLGNTGTLTKVSNSFGTVASAVTVAGTGTGTNPGTFDFTTTNTYTGGTTVGSGILEVANNTALGTGTATVVGGASVVIPAAVTGITTPLALNGFGVAGGGALQANASGTWTSAISLPTTSSIYVAPTFTLNTAGVIGGGGRPAQDRCRHPPAQRRRHLRRRRAHRRRHAHREQWHRDPHRQRRLCQSGDHADGQHRRHRRRADHERQRHDQRHQIVNIEGNVRTTGTGNLISGGGLAFAAAAAPTAVHTISIASGGSAPGATTGTTTGSELNISAAVIATGSITKQGNGTLVYSGGTTNAGDGHVHRRRGTGHLRQDGLEHDGHRRAARHRQLQQQQRHPRRRHRRQHDDPDHDDPAQQPGSDDQQLGHALHAERARDHRRLDPERRHAGRTRQYFRRPDQRADAERQRGRDLGLDADGHRRGDDQRQRGPQHHRRHQPVDHGRRLVRGARGGNGHGERHRQQHRRDRQQRRRGLHERAHGHPRGRRRCPGDRDRDPVRRLGGLDQHRQRHLDRGHQWRFGLQCVPDGQFLGRRRRHRRGGNGRGEQRCGHCGPHHQCRHGLHLGPECHFHTDQRRHERGRHGDDHQSRVGIPHAPGHHDHIAGSVAGAHGQRGGHTDRQHHLLDQPAQWRRRLFEHPATAGRVQRRRRQRRRGDDRAQPGGQWRDHRDHPQPVRLGIHVAADRDDRAGDAGDGHGLGGGRRQRHPGSGGDHQRRLGLPEQSAGPGDRRRRLVGGPVTTASISTAGVVTGVTITGAAGYTSAPVIIIDPPNVAGTAIAVVNSNGSLKLQATNDGVPTSATRTTGSRLHRAGHDHGLRRRRHRRNGDPDAELERHAHVPDHHGLLEFARLGLYLATGRVDLAAGRCLRGLPAAGGGDDHAQWPGRRRRGQPRVRRQRLLERPDDHHRTTAARCRQRASHGGGAGAQRHDRRHHRDQPRCGLHLGPDDHDRLALQRHRRVGLATGDSDGHGHTVHANERGRQSDRRDPR